MRNTTGPIGSTRTTPPFTFKEKWMIFWGFPYILNKRSKEIHWVLNKHQHCNLMAMAKKNKQYITYRKAKELLSTKKADGCRYCLPWEHID
jgi:hypothetical protein